MRKLFSLIAAAVISVTAMAQTMVPIPTAKKAVAVLNSQAVKYQQRLDGMQHAYNEAWEVYEHMTRNLKKVPKYDPYSHGTYWVWEVHKFSSDERQSITNSWTQIKGQYDPIKSLLNNAQEAAQTITRRVAAAMSRGYAGVSVGDLNVPSEIFE